MYHVDAWWQRSVDRVCSVSLSQIQCERNVTVHILPRKMTARNYGACLQQFEVVDVLGLEKSTYNLAMTVTNVLDDYR